MERVKRAFNFVAWAIEIERNGDDAYGYDWYSWATWLALALDMQRGWHDGNFHGAC